MTTFTAPAGLNHILFIEGDEPYTDSARIAAAFNIPHTDVVKAVDEALACSESEGGYFMESYLIVDPTGDNSKLEKAYQITGSGFGLILTALFVKEEGVYPPKAVMLIVEDFLTALGGVRDAILAKKKVDYAEQVQRGVDERLKKYLHEVPVVGELQ